MSNPSSFIYYNCGMPVLKGWCSSTNIRFREFASFNSRVELALAANAVLAGRVELLTTVRPLVYPSCLDCATVLLYIACLFFSHELCYLLMFRLKRICVYLRVVLALAAYDVFSGRAVP